MFLRQSTAVEIKIGPFVDAGDGVTVEDGLTISQADVRLKKNGGDWAQKNEATSAVHEENGNYRCLLDATDTNTLGILYVHINESGTLPVFPTFVVLPAMIYDSLVAGSDRLDTNVTHVADTAQTAGDIPARLPAALTGDGNIKADTLRVSGTAQTAGDINSGTPARAYSGVVVVTAITGTLTTTQFSVSGITIDRADKYKHSTLKGLTGNNANESRAIAGSVISGNLLDFDVPWGVAPANGDTFLLI